jgi:hypothetical protein
MLLSGPAHCIPLCSSLCGDLYQECEDVLKGKEALDAGSEKVILIKLQRMLVAGVEAERKLKFQVR